jgi:catechol 2,3-dioxygenase-like lactoylglutathione lyase family enzyme
MRMNHLDLHVPDVAATSDFLVQQFGLILHEMRGVNGLAILNDKAGLEIVISKPIEKFGGSDQLKLGANTYHIGFMLPEKDAVNRLYDTLKQSGAELWSEPQAIRGDWLFYCLAPGRILIEVGWRPEE